MVWALTLILIGLNGVFKYEEIHATYADCTRARASWQKVKEAQVGLCRSKKEKVNEQLKI